MSTTSQIIKFGLTGKLTSTTNNITETFEIDPDASYITFYEPTNQNQNQCNFDLNVVSLDSIVTLTYGIDNYGNYDWNCYNISTNFLYNDNNVNIIQMPYVLPIAQIPFYSYSYFENNSQTIQVYATFTEVVCSEETVSNKNKTSLKIIRPLCNCNCMYNICPHK